ncbi:GNAT family N-acetyltransferase [Streptomyces capparidis]
MTDFRAKKTPRHPHRRRKELVELAALFAAVAVADVIANLVVHGPQGVELLLAASLALVATAGFHAWWAHSHAPPPPAPEPAPSPPTPVAAPGGEAMLWRMRTTVDDAPGSLAALTRAMAALGADILTLQTHPLSDGTVDEFLLRVPAAVAPQHLTAAVTEAGGRDVWLDRAVAHDLVDTPTRVLTLATRTALDTAELPLALRQLLGRCSIRSRPAGDGTPEDLLDGTTMHLRDSSGGTITVSRPYLPFTPSEFARARALVDLDTRLGPRLPDGRDLLSLPAGADLTIRRAGPEDLAAATAMHARCSARTLRRRYHGPVQDADRYLAHLLSPRFGQTLAAETSSGELVALAHLLWDGEETEVSLLVEDAWQRHGIGLELLRRLVAMAAEAGCTSVYAITQSDNAGMAGLMRRLSLPLDYQVEDATLVITARLVPAGTLSPARPAPDRS